MQIRSIFHRLLNSLPILLIGVIPLQVSSYELIDLGTLDGNNSKGFDVNDYGVVTGTAYTYDGGFAVHAFLYENGSMVDLGTPLNSEDSYGYGINNSGQVAGMAVININDYMQFVHAFLYEGNTWIDLGLTSNSTDSYGRDINDLGQATGYVMIMDPDPWAMPTHAFLYDGSELIDIGTLGGSKSAGNGINNYGQITGESFIIGDSAKHAFIFEGNSMRDIGTLGGSDSSGNDINDLGHVTGWSDTTGDGAIHAFIYNGTRMRDLGTLGGMNSYGYGINNNGSVVGSSQLADGDSAAFLYENNAMFNLCVLTNCLDKGWDTLTTATAINDRGDITGYGDINGETHAFLVLADGQAPPPVEDCEDGIDNDGDGLIDCKDSLDCSQNQNCYEPPPPTGPEICNDDIDNDGDGYNNCDDRKDCRLDPACLNTPPSGGGGGGGGGGKNR